MSYKRIIAREWLIFMGCLLFGVFMFSYLLASIINPSIFLELQKEGKGFYGEVFRELSHGQIYLKTWFGVLLPYLTVQLVRSVFWATKMITKR
jgi:hypothetical protein